MERLRVAEFIRSDLWHLLHRWLGLLHMYQILEFNIFLNVEPLDNILTNEQRT